MTAEDKLLAKIKQAMNPDGELVRLRAVNAALLAACEAAYGIFEMRQPRPTWDQLTIIEQTLVAAIKLAKGK